MSTQTDKSIVWCRNQLTVTAAVEGRGVGSESRAGRDELGFVLVQFEMRVRHLRGKIDLVGCAVWSSGAIRVCRYVVLVRPAPGTCLTPVMEQ